MGHMNLNLTKMLKIKNNDRETLKLYAYFSLKILNDRVTYYTYINRLDDLEQFKYQYEDQEHINIELLEDAKNDNVEYFFISGANVLSQSVVTIIFIFNFLCIQRKKILSTFYLVRNQHYKFCIK